MQRKQFGIVFSRIPTKSCNILEEYEIASRTLSIISPINSNETAETFFSEKPIESYRLQIKEMWDKLVGPTTTVSLCSHTTENVTCQITNSISNAKFSVK